MNLYAMCLAASFTTIGTLVAAIFAFAYVYTVVKRRKLKKTINNLMKGE